jgi:hypothetical protein
MLCQEPCEGQVGERHEHSIADIRVAALYPVRIPALAHRPGVRFRSRKKAAATLVPCRIDALDGRSVASPEYAVPEGTPAPIFRLQLETTRTSVDERRVLCVVLAAERDGWKTDPEQALLSPIFDDGHRMIFEFRRAYILRVDRRGDLETRFVAIDPVRGIVGTKTMHKFDTRLLALASRCVEHLAGAIDLFPMRDRPTLEAARIPVGEANLSFDSKGAFAKAATGAG